MTDKKQKLRIGIFLLSGVLLMVAILFFLGLSDIFKDKVVIMTHFQESVQGLTVGSPVKFRGVQVGAVSDISIMLNEKHVWVTMEVEPDYFKNLNRSSFIKAMKNERKNGLACRLEFAGITGMKFIDFDYFRNGDTPVDTPKSFPGDDSVLYIPSVPSAFRDFSSAVVNAMDRLSKIRFEEISNELERSLTAVTTLLTDPTIKSTLVKINEAADNLESSTSAINQAVNEERLVSLLNDVEENLKALHNLTTTLTEQSRQMKLPESSKSIRKAAGSVVESSQDINATLQKFNRTLESLRTFLDYIGSDPAAFIQGKKQKKILK